MKTSSTFCAAACSILTVGLLGTLPAAPVADSEADFNGTQGEDGWTYGYRIVDSDDDRANYDPDADFMAFEEDDDWTWDGTRWDSALGNVPWTEVGASGGHPNGTNNGDEHWVIRRWAPDIASTTPVAIQWHLHKNNVNCGNGTSVSVHHNGARIDFGAVEGNDGDGIDSVVYANINPGDTIDVALTPEGPDEGTGDSCDGSTWTVVFDDEIPDNAMQPDGTPFVPDTGEDTDNDGLSDSWERLFFPDSLTELSGDGDNDGDGLTDKQEFESRTDPTKEDSDGDGLNDKAEIDNGTNPRSSDTDSDGLDDNAELTGDPATDPTNADTDGDGFSDGDEVALGFDPTDANKNPNETIIASSIDDWSPDAEHGVRGWSNGYRNVTEDGKGDDYDPQEDFIAFDEDDGWVWDGATWDWGDGDVPWTFIGAEGTHPNGDNNGEIHWTIRRWEASSLTADVTPLALKWAIRKENTNCGNGVAGSLHINGKQVDFEAIAGSDGDGVERTYYANVAKDDIIDLALTPEGPDESNNDGCDGSAFSLEVNASIPARPLQPDGSLFVPATATDSDGDNLPDPWELAFFEGDLTKLSGNGDFDNDGLTDKGEFDRESDPTKEDTDDDGLNDNVETATLTFVDANDTGTSPTSKDTDGDGIEDNAEITGDPATNPTKSDSDNDGFSDSEEIANEWDPNDAEDPKNTILADSVEDWSREGEQGVNGWFYGYRNLSADNDNVEEVDYDPAAHFVQYPEEWWRGQTWDFPDGNVPWTTHSSNSTHPNGDNNGEVHWTIRRWVATVEDETTVSINWTTSKQNTNCGNGVTGAIHHNGVRLDGVAIESDDGDGVNRTYYVNIEPGDVIDLINSPMGPDETNNDGCDGSGSTMFVTRFNACPATQPDDSLFDDCIVPGDPRLSFKRTSPFGQLEENPGVQTRTVSLRNGGEANDLVISAAAVVGANASNFSTNITTPLTIAPGETSEIEITFDPKGADGGFVASLDFISNDENRPNKSLDLSANIPDANKLLAWYKMDESEGTQMLDSSGNGNHGTYVTNGNASVALAQNGLAGGTAVALTPDGADAAFANVDRFTAVEGGLTISMWVAPAATQGDVSGLISKGAEIGNPYALAFASNSLLWFGSGAQDIDGAGNLAADTPQHVAVTHTATDPPMTLIYVDGVEVFRKENAAQVNDSSATLQIGAVTSGFGFAGVIDDVQIYGRDLNAEEVQSLRANPGQKLGGGGNVDPTPVPVLSELTKSAEGLSIGISGGEADATYNVEYSDTLEPGSWQVIASDVPATDYQDTDAARLANAAGFYRLATP